jgi:hydroxyacyl-ACP dehydratase HTD2-like protein with hotdog domain
VTEIFTKGHRSGAVAARQPPRNQNDSTHWHAMGEPFTIDVVDCFLYCAAVWLPHRIHYDEPYARSEGHPGVLVPGPFQGSILAAAFAEIVGTDIFGWRLSYRHVGSMVAGQPSQLLTREVASPSRPTELHALLVGPDGAHQTTGVLTKLEPS